MNNLAEVSYDFAAAFHQLEHSAKVYLRAEGGRWVVDSSIADGHPLATALDRVSCNLGDRCRECGTPDGERQADAMAVAPMPTARELLHMLADLHGGVVVYGEGAR
ncbi:hypothetical protein ACQPW1_10235 [Nocardia sp. CA-128927]|uniref:hypothetical protein n=1 Tax=Nocardia sp. CA-128927 TaxID=3239975 RepID=UPI003D996785